ncbi:MAG: peptidylprolyl isomerase [Bacteroidota bacterium]
MNAKLLPAALLVFFFQGCAPKVNLVNTGDPVFRKEAPSVFRVLLETSKGEILLEVHRDWSPNGVDRFYNLVRTGYYDNNYVFRIRATTWAQFGINGNPTIARAWRGQNLPDDVRKESNVRGTVAYAFKDPNGRTTQIFINLRDNSATHDSEPFVPFARVVRGMEVADALYAGYGEKSGGGIRAGHQDSLFTSGNNYLRQNFPLLDSIRRARVVK